MLAFLFLSACAHMTSRQPAQTAVSANPEWDRYLSGIPVAELQADCVPRRLAPTEGVEHKGSIFFIHGYSACPQQFFELAQWYQRRGWAVYLMLMPGHGRLRPQPRVDDFSQIPRTVEAYTEFSDLVNKIASREGVPVAIGGLSVGGAVAAMSALRAPDLYKSMILYSPFFQMAKITLRSAVHMLSWGPHTRNGPQGWGEGCEKEILRGRAGICNFTTLNLQVVDAFGSEVMRIAAEKPLTKTAVQIVAVENDAAASVLAMNSFYYSIKDHTPTTGCQIRAPADHSTISRFDNPDADKFWLGSLLKNSAEFVTEGKPWPSHAIFMEHRLFPTCTLDETLKGVDPLAK